VSHEKSILNGDRHCGDRERGDRSRWRVRITPSNF
jgi:hypothetical protein